MENAFIGTRPGSIQLYQNCIHIFWIHTHSVSRTNPLYSFTFDQYLDSDPCSSHSISVQQDKSIKSHIDIEWSVAEEQVKTCFHLRKTPDSSVLNPSS